MKLSPSHMIPVRGIYHIVEMARLNDTHGIVFTRNREMWHVIKAKSSIDRLASLVGIIMVEL